MNLRNRHKGRIVLMFGLLLALLQLATAADNASFDSTHAPEDVALTADPV